MPCISAPYVAPPVLSVPGISVGFALPSFDVGVDFCCKIGVGPWPVLPPFSIAILAPIMPTINSVLVTLNATFALYAAYIDEVLSYISISCPLED